jgi:hypothetical protein
VFVVVIVLVMLVPLSVLVVGTVAATVAAEAAAVAAVFVFSQSQRRRKLAFGRELLTANQGLKLKKRLEPQGCWPSWWVKTRTTVMMATTAMTTRVSVLKSKSWLPEEQSTSHDGPVWENNGATTKWFLLLLLLLLLLFRRGHQG